MKNFVVVFLTLSSIYTFNSFADSPEDFYRSTGFQDGEYFTSNHELAQCDCTEFSLEQDADGSLTFFSMNCVGIDKINKGKQQWRDGRCQFESTARLAGKLLTYSVQKKCAGKNAKKYPSDLSDQKDTTENWAVSFVDNGFNYTIEKTLGGKAQKSIKCSFKKVGAKAEGEPDLPEGFDR